MLSLGGCPPPPPPPTTAPSLLTKTLLTLTLHSQSKPHKTHLSIHQFPHTYLTFRVSALKDRRKDDETLVEVEDIDEEDNEDEEVDEDEVFVPFENMKAWLENRPSGFGEGKVYDTSVEDKLFEEMRVSREAQLANINNLKNNPIKPTSKKDDQKAAEGTPSGIPVRIVNLPKKKNVHRDLKLAFKGVPGLLNIVPAVLGNKKTRDPICKGFAFAYFKSQEHANSFVQMFSSQNISFGKIQKQIRCEFPNSNSVREQPPHNTLTHPLLKVQNVDININNASLASFEEEEEEDSFDETDSEEEEEDEFDESDSGSEDLLVPAKAVDNIVKLTSRGGGDSIDPSDVAKARERIRELEKKLLSKQNGGNIPKLNTPESANSSVELRTGTNKREKTQKVGKKLPKHKGDKVRKLNIPGSAKRLMIKEKAVLTDVFSKYGAKAASALRPES